MPAGPRLAATEAMLRVCFFPLPQGGRRDEWAGADRTNDYANPVAASELPFQKPVIGNSGSAFCYALLQLRPMVPNRSLAAVIRSWPVTHANSRSSIVEARGARVELKPESSR